MNVFIPNSGLLELCQNCFGPGEPFAGIYYLIDLYQNEPVYSPYMTPADLEVANFTGYAQVQRARSDMALPYLDSGGAVTLAEVNPLKWQNLGTQQMLYGYSVVSAVTGALLWVNPFEFPWLLEFNQILSVDFGATFVNLGL